MKKEKMEVTEATTTELTIPMDNSDWGDVAVESKDIIIPRLIMQQSGSDLVKDDKAKAGDYVSSLTSEPYSEGGKCILLPFLQRQYIRIEKKVGNKFQFHAIEDYTGKLPPIEEYSVGGDTFKKYHVYEFYCLSKEGGIPFAISFKSTSNKTGKKLFHKMYVENKHLGKVPASNWIELGSVNVDKNGNKYKVMDIKFTEESSKEDQLECLKWIKTFKTTSISVTEEIHTESVDEDIENSRY